MVISGTYRKDLTHYNLENNGTIPDLLKALLPKKDARQYKLMRS